MYSKEQANQILSRKRRSNSGMFEEMRAGDAERECYEEKCNLEEVYEIFDHDKQTTMTFWNQTVNQCRYAPQRCQLQKNINKKIKKHTILPKVKLF